MEHLIYLFDQRGFADAVKKEIVIIAYKCGCFQQNRLLARFSLQPMTTR